MLKILAEYEAMLPELLEDASAWSSKCIDYHPPKVERVYRDHGGYRVNLHRTHPCALGEALFHPHPWPSAMLIADGAYRMRVGYGAGVKTPPIAATLILERGTRYEMIDPDAWHDVTPASNTPAYSLMVTGAPWSRDAPVMPSVVLPPLEPQAKRSILEFFKAWTQRG